MCSYCVLGGDGNITLCFRIPSSDDNLIFLNHKNHHGGK
jgi:hypothetical protein